MTRAFVFAATFITLVSGTAYADVIPPEVYACNNLSTGSPCDNGAGVCQDSTCSRLDYSKWDRDASASPPSTSYSCKKCMPKGTGTGTGATTTTGTGVTTTTGTGATTTTGTGVTTSVATGTGTGATTTTVASTGTGATTTTATTTSTGKEEESKDSSGCSVSGARAIAPWLLAGIFAACVSLLRRRPRR